MDTSKDFLTPGSMLTPGFAGGMTMAITNATANQFGISAPGPAYVGLGRFDVTQALCPKVLTQRPAARGRAPAS
jgi:hypothetical protein